MSSNQKYYINTFLNYDINDKFSSKKRNMFPCLKPDRSCFYFKKTNRLRIFIGKIVNTKAFEAFIMICIFFSCLGLSLTKMYPNNDSNDLNDKLENTELPLILIFAIESIMKIILYGFVLHAKSYLRNFWNVLDFIIVVLGIVTYILSVTDQGKVDIKALRAFRVLRPLRLISKMPSLQIVLNSIIIAIKPLANILLLVLFLIIIFSIVGISLFSGIFHFTCYNNVTKQRMSNPKPCNPRDNSLGYLCDNLPNLPVGQVWSCLDMYNNSLNVLRFPGPNIGITSFDNMGFAMLTVFQIITKEGWTDIMYMVNDVYGNSWPWVFFIPLVILGSYFLLNLIIGILCGQFTKEKLKVERQNEFIKEKQNLKDTDDYLFYKDWIEQGDKIINELLDESSVKTTFEIQDNLIVDDERNNKIYENVFDRILGKLKSTSKKIEPYKLKAQNYLLNIIKTRYYFIVILVLVFINSLIMATEYIGQPYVLSQFQALLRFCSDLGFQFICHGCNTTYIGMTACHFRSQGFDHSRLMELIDNYSNMFFLILFTIELLLKLFSLGFKNYFIKPFNIYDFIIITVSVIEMSLVITNVMNQIGFSILRSVRLLRVFKLTKHWDNLKKMVNNMVRSIKSILSLLLLIVLFMIIASLLGMQLFGGKFISEDGSLYRTNFDDMLIAIITVFQLMTIEGWNREMYKGIQFLGGAYSLGSLASIYYIVVILVGNYLLLNVFFAIVLEILNSKNDEEPKKIKDTDSDFDDDQDSELEVPVTKELVMINDLPIMPPNVPNDIESLNPVLKKNRGNVNFEQRVRITFKEAEDTSKTPEPLYHKVAYKEIYAEDDEDAIIFNIDEKLKITPEINKLLELKQKLANIPIASSLFIFSQSNKFRIFCHRVINHSLTKKILLVIIVSSCIMIAFFNPLQPDTTQAFILNIFDYIFTIFFTLELIINMISYGVIFHKGSYLRNAFNWIDFIVVFIGILDVILVDVEMSALKTLRVLRVIKTLRTINKAKELKHLINSVAITMGNIWKIILIKLLFGFIFSVIGVIQFKGSFYACSDISQRTEDNCKGTYIYYAYDGSYQAKVMNRTWSNNQFNYDNVLNGMMTLFVVSTFQGYGDILFTNIDAVREYEGPYFNNNRYIFFFYLIYLIIDKFFLINIFIGFVVISYQQARESEYKSEELDKNQKKCIALILKSKPIFRYVPMDRYRFRIWQLVTSEKFNNFIFLIIILNTITMSLGFDKNPQLINAISDIFNYIFICLFTIEVILKIIAFNFRNYFDDKMNIFDFIVVLGSFVDVIFMNQEPAVDGALRINIFRLFRSLRLVKLLMKNKSIRGILWTFINAFNTLPWVILLVLMILYIYAIIGMQFFGKIALNNTGSEITTNNNFQTLFNSFIVLLRCITGEKWHKIMISCVDNNKSRCQLSSGTCGTPFSYFYFISFIILSNYLIMNLFLAVIIEKFDYLTKDSSNLGPHHLETFIEQWSYYDIGARGRITPLDVVDLLTKINPPLGFGKMCPQDKCLRKLMHMNMPLEKDGTICFRATLFALVRRNLRIKLPLNSKDLKSIEEYNEELRLIIKRLWPKTSDAVLEEIIPSNVMNTVTVGKFYATFLIQDFFRKYKLLKKEKEEKIKIESLITQEDDEVINISSMVFHKNDGIDSIQAKGEAIAAVKNTYNGLIGTIWQNLKSIFIMPDEEFFEK